MDCWCRKEGLLFVFFLESHVYMQMQICILVKEQSKKLRAAQLLRLQQNARAALLLNFNGHCVSKKMSFHYGQIVTCYSYF